MSKREEAIEVFRRAEGMRRFAEIGCSMIRLSTDPFYDHDAAFAPDAVPKRAHYSETIDFHLKMIPLGRERYCCVMAGDELIISPFHWDPLIHERSALLLVVY